MTVPVSMILERSELLGVVWNRQEKVTGGPDIT